MDKLLTILFQTEVTLKLPKSHFFQLKIKCLDHLFTSGIQVAASKDEDQIKIAAFSSDSTERRSFLR